MERPNAAEATMIERQISPSSFAPKKSNTGMIIGIAAALVIVLGGGYFFWKSKQTAAPVAPVSTTVVTTTAPTSTAPIPAGKGVLLLSASPWGELDKIVDDKGQVDRHHRRRQVDADEHRTRSGQVHGHDVRPERQVADDERHRRSGQAV